MRNLIAREVINEGQDLNRQYAKVVIFGILHTYKIEKFVFDTEIHS